MSSRDIEHQKSQTLDIARRSSVAKKGDAAPIHPGMASRTNTTLGAPPTGAPPDASSPMVTDPSRMGKAFPVPAVTFGMKGKHDPGLAAAILGECKRSSDDFARDLHTAPSK